MPAPSDVGRVEETREIPALEIRAAVRPGSINTEKRTVDVVWSTGARVLRGFYDRFWEELSLDPKHVRMERLESGRAPLIDNHYGEELGVVETARLDGKEGTARVRFAKAEDDPEADRRFRKIQDGIGLNVSVGYKVHRFERVGEAPGPDGHSIPVMRATDWTPYEISFVTIPAETGAHVRSLFDARASNPCTFITREEPRMDPIKPETTTTTTPANPATPVVDAAREAEIRAEAIRTERERQTGIRTAVRAVKLDDKFAETLIADEKMTLDAARAAIIGELAKRDEEIPTRQHVRAEITDDKADKWLRGATAWLIQRAGLADTIRAAMKIKPESWKGVELDPGEFRGMSLRDLARESLERHGIRTRGLDSMELVGTAFTRGGYNTTSDFAVLLENVMHKSLLAAYQTTPDTWTRFCATDTASDFRDKTLYRTGSFGKLDKVSEHGEFKNKSIPDGSKEKVALQTWGNIIGLSRQAIVNDDMSVFVRLPSQWGRAAKLTVEMEVYATLALNSNLGPTMNDGNPLFHGRTNVDNITTGAALAAAAIDTDRVRMGGYKDISGNEILEIRPAILLVPLSLGGTARVINESQYDPDTVANKAQMKPNLVRGLFRDVVDSARLSGTRRYLFADPAVAPALVVLFLDGQQEPVMESKDGWRTDGTEWKVRLDFAVDGLDPAGCLTNAGA